jgi:hypothetical protein
MNETIARLGRILVEVPMRQGSSPEQVAGELLLVATEIDSLNLRMDASERLRERTGRVRCGINGKGVDHIEGVYRSAFRSVLAFLMQSLRQSDAEGPLKGCDARGRMQIEVMGRPVKFMVTVWNTQEKQALRVKRLKNHTAAGQGKPPFTKGSTVVLRLTVG